MTSAAGILVTRTGTKFDVDVSKRVLLGGAFWNAAYLHRGFS